MTQQEAAPGRKSSEDVSFPGDANGQKVSIVKVMKHDESRRALFSAVPTLTLGIMGGAVLPLSWAFSVTGVLCGMLMMMVVALANTYTSDLLLKQAYVTRTYDYEELALAVGGRWWKITTEISIVVLLMGTLIGGLAQVGEAGVAGIICFASHAPPVLIGGGGRLLIVIAVLCLVAPLCLFKELRQLEYAGIVGTGIVIWLMIAVIINSTQHNLPALTSGTFAVVGFSSIGYVTKAVSIFGFAFYIQPIMMPLLAEMPDGKVGMKIVSYSTRITVLGNAFVIYFLVGFFGAAYYGDATQSNILENKWLGGGVAQGLLNIFMATYLALALPTIAFPTRHTIDGWIPKEWLPNAFIRILVITTLILVVSTTIALIWPSSSGTILVVTGATGVCMVSYIIPVVNHLALRYDRAICQRATIQTSPDVSNSETDSVENFEDVEQPKVEKTSGTNPPSYRKSRKEGIVALVLDLSKEFVLPVAVLLVGVFCSVASLTTLGSSS